MNKQNKIIVGVVALVLALTIGYAIFSQSLNINGTAKAEGNLDIVFNEVGEISPHGTNTPTATITENGRKLELSEITLDYPTAYVDIPVTIVNNGTVDGVLESITVENLETDDIKVTINDVAENQVIKMYNVNDETTKVKATIRVEWLDKTDTKTESVKNISITLNAKQLVKEVVTTKDSSNSFPVVQGSLGDNITFTYDNGNISIDGNGDMGDGLISGDYGYCKSYVAILGTNNCTLSADIAVKLMEKLSTSNETVDSLLIQLMPAYISGIKTEIIEGRSEDEIKNELYESFQKEDVDKAFDILSKVPTLKSINIGENVTSLRDDLLYGTKIDSIIIPDSVKDIGSINSIYTDTLKIGKGVEILSAGVIKLSTINNLVLSEGLNTIAQGAIEKTVKLETIVNKTGKAFDWNGILTGTSGEAFETGTVEDNGKTITITK